MVGAVMMLVDPRPPSPYWVDAVHLSAVSGCTIFVTLYLIGRSGEPWEQFGLKRPLVLDVLSGAMMFFIAWVLLVILPPLPDIGRPEGQVFSNPRGAGDLVLMVLKLAIAGFAEELVTRAYLITRLTELLRSRGEAVVCAAVLFASYHAYQGLGGVGYTFAFGVVYGIAFLVLGRVWPLAIGHALYNMHVQLLHA
jgi:membrane protease YdiL (CAAX protease family)